VEIAVGSNGKWQVSCNVGHMLRLAAVGFIGLLILPACSSSNIAGSVPSRATKGSAGGVPDSGGGDGSAQSVFPRPIPHGGNPTDLLVRYTVGGGYSGTGMAWAGLPLIALFGDGRLIFATVTSNAMSDQMQEAHVSGTDIEAILEHADALGLFAGSTSEPSAADIAKGNFTADADQSELTLRAGDRCVTHRKNPPPLDGAIAAVVADLLALTASDAVAATAEPWRFESVALTYSWTGPYLVCANAPAWPLQPPPAASQNTRVCSVVDRQAASTLAPVPPHDDSMLAAGAGDQIDGGVGCIAYKFRPLLPGEAGCTDTSFPGCTPQP
jgi:hypothetical protein